MSGRKSKTKLTQKNNEKIAALKISLEVKKEWMSKALQAVENLLEGSISKESLLTNCQVLNQEYYRDVKEERGILLLCGYPLCGNKINVKPHQYHISSKYNKVFDITERKLFCSNVCFKSSQFLELQLPTCPVWLLNKEPCKPLSLLQEYEKSEGLGEEVKFEDSGLTYGINECVRECKSRGSIVSTTSKLKVTETNQSTSNHNDTKVLNASDTGIQTNENLLLGNTADVSAVIKDGHIQKQKRVWSKFRSVPNSVSSGEETLSTIHLVEKCVKDWLTIETVKYLLGPEKYSEILNDETLIIETDKSSELKKGENERQIVTKFKRLCKKLDFEEREDNALDAEFIRTECNASMKKKVPSYERLSRETKKYNLKVEAFYNGKMEILSDEDDETNVSNNSRTKDTKECVSTNESSLNTINQDSQLYILPLVDSSSQSALRRRIVLDRLNKSKETLVRILDLSHTELSVAFHELVQTFSLQASNISFKPDEWVLVTVAVVNLLSIKDEGIRLALENDASRRYVASVLEPFKENPDYFKCINIWLMETINISQLNTGIKSMHLTE